MKPSDLTRKYENRYVEPPDDQKTIAMYQALLAYLLAQPWYQERLPQIRKHVEDHIIRKP